MTVEELQSRMSSEEFVQWMRYMDLEVNFFHREDYFLAQIAAEVRREHVKKPSELSVEDMLIKFEPAEKKPEPVSNLPIKPLSAGEAQVLRSKLFWLQAGTKTAPGGTGSGSGR